VAQAVVVLYNSLFYFTIYFLQLAFCLFLSLNNKRRVRLIFLICFDFFPRLAGKGSNA